MKFELRQATVNDFELLYNIKTYSIKPYVEKVWGWDENFQKEFLRRETPIEHVKIILIEDKQVAGFIQIEEKEDEIFVGSLFLTSRFQSKGIGKSILENIFNKRKIVRLEVLKINTRAIRFYQTIGMEIAGEDELKYKMIKE